MGITSIYTKFSTPTVIIILLLMILMRGQAEVTEEEVTKFLMDYSSLQFQHYCKFINISIGELPAESGLKFTEGEIEENSSKYNFNSINPTPENELFILEKLKNILSSEDVIVGCYVTDYDSSMSDIFLLNNISFSKNELFLQYIYKGNIFHLVFDIDVESNLELKSVDISLGNGHLEMSGEQFKTTDFNQVSNDLQLGAGLVLNSISDFKNIDIAATEIFRNQPTTEFFEHSWKLLK